MILRSVQEIPLKRRNVIPDNKTIEDIAKCVFYSEYEPNIVVNGISYSIHPSLNGDKSVLVKNYDCCFVIKQED